jgi:flagellar basal-body rod protein FlgG
MPGMTGIQSLVATMQAQWQRHEVLANNLANLSTPGFKADDLAVAPDQNPAALSPSALSGVAPTGHGVVQWTDYSQGPLRETGRNLDVALNGPGFLAVQTPGGVRYTRAGVFAVSREGQLVTSTGFPVLGEKGPIALGATRVTVTDKGEILQDGNRIDTLRVVDFPRPYLLLKEGNGLFVPATAEVAPQTARDYEVVAGSLEGSNVNPVETMVGMIDVLRRYEAAQRAIQAVHEASRQATTDIGRV